MGQTLENGVYLPSEGERNCYAGLKTNWEILDQKVADVTALQQAVAGALHREIVESLPTTDIDPNTIYMILSGTSATENVYNEFMYVNNAWELIGTSATDLTNYYTKSEVDGKLLLKANASDLTSHTGDTTIHVTTADKTKWNNQTYVFRYSSTALVASSTNANSLLDNTDNLKVGDKVIDSSGVLFSITAIDTANSTFTIGTALIDLATDGDVVHKSGSETITGNKTFSSNINAYNSDSTGNVSNLVLKNSIAERGVATNTQQTIYFADKNDAYLGYINIGVTASAVTQMVFKVYDANNQSDGFSLRKTTTATTVQPSTNNAVNLGTSSGRWKDVSTYLVNGVEPSSLSLPSGNVSDFIDISSYFSNTGSGDTNSYTALANGWIFLRLGDISSCQVILNDSSDRRLWGTSATGNVEQIIMPILKNTTLTTTWVTNSTVNVATARFIPCQGNV